MSNQFDVNSVNELEQAIRLLYQTFANYRPGDNFADCSWLTQDAAKILTSKPLAELSVQEIEEYASHAVSFCGDTNDYKYFLPRILELLAIGENPYLNTSSIFFPLYDADWQNWSPNEKSVVDKFFVELWKRLLNTYPFHLYAEECLNSFAWIIEDLTPYLHLWRQNRSLSSLQHLAFFIVDTTVTYQPYRRKLRNEAWGLRNNQMDQVLDWLFQPETVEMLEYGILTFALDEFVEALDALQWFKMGPTDNLLRS
jgi:hypothetical protein